MSGNNNYEVHLSMLFSVLVTFALLAETRFAAPAWTDYFAILS
jgi:hypothetical protein